MAIKNCLANFVAWIILSLGIWNSLHLSFYELYVSTLLFVYSFDSFLILFSSMTTSRFWSLWEFHFCIVFCIFPSSIGMSSKVVFSNAPSMSRNIPNANSSIPIACFICHLELICFYSISNYKTPFLVSRLFIRYQWISHSITFSWKDVSVTNIYDLRSE